MSQTMMPLVVMAIACVGLITIIATKLSRLTNYLARQEAKTNLILKQMGIEAPKLKIDPVGYDFVPFGYAAGQVLAQAVEATKSLDDAKLADYMHANVFNTVLGEIGFGKEGEWTKPRQFTTQFQNVTGHGVDQFRDTTRQVVLWPDEYKTGNMIPYDLARKKP